MSLEELRAMVAKAPADTVENDYQLNGSCIKGKKQKPLGAIVLPSTTVSGSTTEYTSKVSYMANFAR